MAAGPATIAFSGQTREQAWAKSSTSFAAVSDSSRRESSTSGSILATLQLAIRRIARTKVIAGAENWLAMGG